MTSVDDTWIATQEEPLLATYLVGRVCGRAAGSLEAECTHNAPRDKYFIGSIRPSPGAPGVTEPRSTFLDELLTKLAPMAFGVELRIRPEGTEAQVSIRLEWSCYYRVFPTLAEQREHQRHIPASDSVGQPTEEPESPEETQTAQDADADEDVTPTVAVQASESSEAPRRRRRSAATDTLFRKYRKIRCAAEGPVVVRTIAGAWSIDAIRLEESVNPELVRAREVMLADPDHLRVGRDPDEKLRVPREALETADAYEAFKRQLTIPILPDWRWALTVNVRSGDEAGDLLFVFEATNVSDIEARSWHSDGFFFDVTASLRIKQATVLPFELEVAPRSFRYDRHLWGRGFNCAVVARMLESGERVFETTNAPVYAQPRYRANTEPAAPFDGLGRNPGPVFRGILDAMKEDDRSWPVQRARYEKEDVTWEERHGAEYDNDHRLFQAELARFEHGRRLIDEDADVRLAFQLTNQAFGLGGHKTAWRLFQIVFIVSQIPAIHALKTPTDAGTQDRSIVDIIYYPTGGGKTEAYLGVIVFHCFFDRLRGKTAGVTTWTRFPLRLLTLQQTQRVADVIGAAELVRRSHADTRLSARGVDGFAVGYFVGQEATPNELKPPRRGDPPDPNWSIACDETAGRVARVVEKYRASPSGVSTLRDLPSRGARQVFPSVHPTELDGSAS